MAKKPKRAMTATNEEVEAFLKGTNPQEHIIKIECDFNDDQATVIWRDENFQKHYTKEPFYPFCWAKQEAGRQMFGGNREILKLELQAAGIECKGLAIANSDGDVHPRMQNGYNIMFHAIRPMSNQQFQKFFDKADVPIKPKPTHPTHGKNYYKTVAPNEQFMIETGKRLFKGYESYDDLLRMQFDIETSGLVAQKDTLDQIGCRTNKGFEKIITVEGETPEEYFKNAYNAMLEFYEDIAEIDPDIISGYNSENFDWNFFDIFSQTHYDETLAEMSKSPKLPRGIYKRKQETVLKLGGEVEYYKPTVCWGKHITDCLFSVRRAQALDSNMKKATLKYVTKYAGIEKKNRVYVPGNLIHKTWKDTNVNYAFNDEDGKWFEITEKNLEKHYYSKKLIDTIIEPQTKFGVEWIADEEYEIYQKTGVLNLEDVEVEYTINKVEKINLYDDYYCVKYSYVENVEKNIYEDVDEGLKYTKFDDHIIDNETGGTYQFVTGQYIVKRYLLDDLWETDKVELRFNESNFLVGKMLPVNFERMCTMGTATIWKYIMLAWSYEHELAIPDEISSRSFTGGLSRLLTVGYIPNVQKLDYNSLYPSIILTFGIKTKVDISGAMPAMLEYILTNREFYKDKKAEWDDKATELEKYLKVLKSDKEMTETEFNALPEVQQIIEDIKIAKANKIRNDKLQLPLKITANAFFGSFGAGGGIFNWSDMDCAEETTCCGRQMLRLMLHWFSQKGYQGIVCDTDGMNFRQPDSFKYTEENPYISTGMNRNTKKGEKYVGPWGDLAEFNDLFMRHKNGLGIDEFVPSSCYIARKNYIDLLDVNKQKVKLVGNTLKSKKMPIYIEKFIDSSVRDLLNDRGYEFLEKYYDKIEEIYNLRIPLKDIASVGKIKMSLEDYKAACKQRTKAGTKKARQAWYELAIANNLNVNMGDSIYYINTGKKKNESDIKRVTHFYEKRNGEKVDVTKEYKKEWDNLKKIIKDKSEGYEEAKAKLYPDGTETCLNLEKYINRYHPTAFDEDELIFNCIMVPASVVEDEKDHFCDEEFEYNVDRYIHVFNQRIKPQLVCFDKSIRLKQTVNKKGEIVEDNNILITNPKDRKTFTRAQAKLVSGQPYKENDQDTYEQLMTMEDKEIRFWISVNKIPVYAEECGMDWEKIKADYLGRMEVLKKDGVREEYGQYQKMVKNLTSKERTDFLEDGVLPDKIAKFCEMNYDNGDIISKQWNVKLGTMYDIIEVDEQNKEIDEDNVIDMLANKPISQHQQNDLAMMLEGFEDDEDDSEED